MASSAVAAVGNNAGDARARRGTTAASHGPAQPSAPRSSGDTGSWDVPVKTVPWTEEEHDQLLALVQEHGRAWTYISSTLPGRDPLAVKNYYYSLLRRMKRRGILQDGVVVPEAVAVPYKDSRAPLKYSVARQVARASAAASKSIASGDAELYGDSAAVKCLPTASKASRVSRQRQPSKRETPSPESGADADEDSCEATVQEDPALMVLAAAAVGDVTVDRNDNESRDAQPASAGSAADVVLSAAAQGVEAATIAPPVPVFVPDLLYYPYMALLYSLQAAAQGLPAPLLMPMHALGQPHADLSAYGGAIGADVTAASNAPCSIPLTAGPGVGSTASLRHVMPASYLHLNAPAPQRIYNDVLLTAPAPFVLNGTVGVTPAVRRSAEASAWRDSYHAWRAWMVSESRGSM